MGIKITKIGVTSDKISARGGLPLFLRYIERIGLYKLISSNVLSLVTKNGKGLQLQEFLKQIFAFFMDGTNMAITGFDQLKNELPRRKQRGIMLVNIYFFAASGGELTPK